MPVNQRIYKHFLLSELQKNLDKANENRPSGNEDKNNYF